MIAVYRELRDRAQQVGFRAIALQIGDRLGDQQFRLLTGPFPPEEGWYDHRVVLREIPAEGIRLDNYWLTWQLHEAPLLTPPAA